MAADHQHIYVVGDPHCRRCYERSDAVDAVWIDLRAGRSETHPTSLRAGPVPTLTSFEEAVTPPGVVQRLLRGQKDRPTYDPKGAA